MHMGRQILVCGAVIFSLYAGDTVKAQQPMADAIHTVRQPYNIETFGAFRMLNGDGAQRALSPSTPCRSPGAHWVCFAIHGFQAEIPII